MEIIIKYDPDLPGKKILLEFLNEKIERLGGDGPWTKYTEGILKDNEFGLENEKKYTVVWENYTLPYMILDDKNKVCNLNN